MASIASESKIEYGFIGKLTGLKYTYRSDIRDRNALEQNFRKKFDDVLFINASEHFEKGKRQNSLRPEDIEKIVETYQYRKEEDRYSRWVSMDEIEKNDDNLNISRYVSTAIAVEEIDLKKVHLELVEIEKKIADARKRHNEFLRELGLEGV